jgi:hypothetical protein
MKCVDVMRCVVMLFIDGGRSSKRHIADQRSTVPYK